MSDGGGVVGELNPLVIRISFVENNDEKCNVGKETEREGERIELMTSESAQRLLTLLPSNDNPRDSD